MSESTPTYVGCKQCGKCAQVKPLSDFGQQRGRVRSACKACINEYSRDRYRDDPDWRARHKALRDRWRAENPTYLAENYQQNREQRIAAAIEYAKRNPPDPGRTRELARARYAADPERFRDKKRKWEVENAELARETRRRAASRRRARMRGLPAEMYTMDQLLERDGTLCVLCSEELDLTVVYPDPLAPTVEHLECIVWEDSAGDVLSNVAVSHWACNNARRTRPHPAAARKRAELLAVERVS